jgi:hypothetical protein
VKKRTDVDSNKANAVDTINISHLQVCKESATVSKILRYDPVTIEGMLPSDDGGWCRIEHVQALIDAARLVDCECWTNEPLDAAGADALEKLREALAQFIE